ncbi:MAG: CBS domain-containing protein [Rubrivivax sp.]
MNLGTLCKRHVVSIDRGQSLHQAARLMREQHVGSIVVTDDSAEGRRVIGIVTDRDLAIEVLADSGTALAQPVGELLDGTLVSAPSHAGLEQGIDLMRAAGVRHRRCRAPTGRAPRVAVRTGVLVRRRAIATTVGSGRSVRWTTGAGAAPTDDEVRGDVGTAAAERGGFRSQGAPR